VVVMLDLPQLARKLRLVAVVLLSIAIVGYVVIEERQQRKISEWVDPW
jgi:hypothetical protein